MPDLFVSYAWTDAKASGFANCILPKTAEPTTMSDLTDMADRVRASYAKRGEGNVSVAILFYRVMGSP